MTYKSNTSERTDCTTDRVTSSCSCARCPDSGRLLYYLKLGALLLG